ncbi:hypothetical protein GCM10023310_09960 [Paenibacillus vulneris]
MPKNPASGALTLSLRDSPEPQYTTFTGTIVFDSTLTISSSSKAKLNANSGSIETYFSTKIMQKEQASLLTLT